MTACTHADDNAGASLEQSIGTPQSRMIALAPSHAVPPQPIATLPEAAGSIGAVRGHAYVNGLRQDILLRGGAVKAIQNSITVLARTTGQQTLDEQVPLYKPTEAAIRSEIGAQFPHVAMQVATRESGNAYGAYGLALGRAGGDARCLYMWQWIDENRLPHDAGVSGPMSVRVRLCQSGTTFDAMAGLVDHLSIGTAPAGTPSDGVASDDRARIVLAPAEADAPGPRKPSRHVATHHRGRIAKRQADDVANRELPQGPRYMASSPEAVRSRPMPDATPSATIPRLASDLPPQAYLGPKALSSKTY